MSEQEQIRAALAQLTATLAGIARTADEKDRERCPYKAADLHCTYAGGCRNQQRESKGVIHCTGDHLIDWSPPYEIRDTEYDLNQEPRTADSK